MAGTEAGPRYLSPQEDQPGLLPGVHLDGPHLLLPVLQVQGGELGALYSLVIGVVY